MQIIGFIMKLFIFVQVHYYIFNNMTSMILKDSRKLQNYSLKYGAKVYNHCCSSHEIISGAMRQ